MKRLVRYWWVAGILLAVAVVLLSPLASRAPDGLERVAEEKGFIDEAEPSAYELMPDYSVRGLGGGAVSTIAAGLIGTVLVFALVYGLSRVIRRRAQAREDAGRESRDGGPAVE